jgi:hypothetical protein
MKRDSAPPGNAWEADGITDGVPSGPIWPTLPTALRKPCYKGLDPGDRFAPPATDAKRLRRGCRSAAPQSMQNADAGSLTRISHSVAPGEPTRLWARQAESLAESLRHGDTGTPNFFGVREYERL